MSQIPKNYDEYELDDFIADEFFVRWVKYAESEADYFWKKWLVNHPEKAPLIAQAQDFVLSVSYRHRAEPTELEFLQVLEGIHRKEQVAAKERAWVKWWRYAAGIGVFLSISWAAYWFGGHHPAGEQAALPPPQEQVWVERTNPAGQKSSLLLPDGTRVRLNAASSIRLEQGLNGQTREVYLTGEAFFQVAHDSARPFIIHTGQVSTTVLGTSFNVRAYPQEDLMVAVESGKVAVGESGQPSVLLDADDLLEVNTLNKDFILKRDTDIGRYTAWQSGVLVYQDSPLSDIVRDIERWYGVSIQITGGVAITARYDGYFDNQTLENVLQGLCYVSNLSYRKEGKKVVLSKK